MEQGATVGGFRIERRLGAGSTGVVYEATQLSLQRPVALRLIEPAHFDGDEELARFDMRQRVTAALHHRNLVPYYEAGEWEGGRFVATRLIRGKTLAALCSEGRSPAAERLEPIAAALRVAHAAGLAHGRVSDANVLADPDGTLYLADLGLHGGVSPEDDAGALAALGGGLPTQAALTHRRRRRHAAVAAAAGAAVVLTLAIAGAGGGGDPQPQLDAPPPAPGTVPVGSTLAPDAIRPLGCGENPSANTPACTLAHARLDGRTATVPRAGVIRSWAVRGASGVLTLQVIRERAGRSFVAGFSRPERVTDPDPRAFRAELEVRPGDRIGVRLGRGAVVGARDGSSSAAALWDRDLTADSGARGGTPIDAELMLRADVELGARPSGPSQLRGARAASAPRGRRLADVPVGRAGRAAHAVVVELDGGTIALDIVRGRRLSRLSVPDADPDGQLLGLEPACGPAPPESFCLHWRNPGAERPLMHAYRIGRTGGIEQLG